MSWSSKRTKKLLKLCAVAAAVLFLLHSVKSFWHTDKAMEYQSSLAEYVQRYTEEQQSKEHSKSGPNNAGAQDPHTMLVHRFFRQLFHNVEKHRPEGTNVAEYDEKCNLNGNVGSRKDHVSEWWRLTGRELGKCLKLTQRKRMMLRDAHLGYVNSVKQMSELPAGTYQGDGIVTVGGGKFSLLAFLVVKTMRDRGTTLPVEVFIPPNDEGDRELCDVLLPQYNAKCIYLSSVFPQDVIDTFDFKGYQFKSLAMIASSFKNLLLLDADNFPILPLDEIFESDVYKNTGLVVWPDFWRRTTHPAYYDIAGVHVTSKRVRNAMDTITPPSVYTKDLNILATVPLHDLEGTIPDVSTESGQMLIDKTRHLPTVLLSLYYNIYGPSWYYSIFSQRSAGEGDKETFIAAANFYNLPFYQVRTEPRVDGYHQPNNKGFRGVSMFQHDFRQDYKRYLQANKEITDKYSSAQGARAVPAFDPEYNYIDSYLGKYFTDDPVDIMFVHSHLPKFDPVRLAADQDLIHEGKPLRAYRNLQGMKGYDLELEQFKTIKDVVCDKPVKFKYLEQAVKSSTDLVKICDYVTERLQFLNRTHEDALESKFD